MGKNSCSVLSRLWTEVHEILAQHRWTSVLSNALTLLSMSRFVLQIFTIKSHLVVCRDSILGGGLDSSG